MELESYLGKIKAYLFATMVSFAGKCGLDESEGPDTLIFAVPAPNAIDGYIEAKVRILDYGMELIWSYSKPLLNRKAGGVDIKKYRVAADLTVEYNGFSDSSDNIRQHTMCIDRENGDIYWHTLYPRIIYYPWTEEGTLPVLQDIFYTQPQRLERMCYPIVSALMGKIAVVDAIDEMRRIREEL